MLKNNWLGIIVVVVSLMIGWIALVYLANWPVSAEAYSVCSVCRAGKTVTYRFLIPMRVKVRENEFSRYYHSYSDPQHRHIWLRRGGYRENRTGGVSGHGTPGPLTLRYEAALGILKALPDAKSRKRFFERLAVVDDTGHSSPKLQMQIEELNQIYYANEQRKDWLVQVRKAGLYP